MPYQIVTKSCDRNRTMMDMEKGINLYHLLRQTLLLGIEGDVVELGCYRGLTAALIRETLNRFGSRKALHVYDSFEGLPDKSDHDLVDSDAQMRRCDYLDNKRLGAGWFASPQEALEKTFQERGLELPVIHKGWFSETLPGQLPEKISFAHLDGDFYDSTLQGLEAVYPRLVPGGVIVIDDYCDVKVHKRQNSLPGVKRACDVFFADKPEEVEILPTTRQYQACVTKKPLADPSAEQQ